jgi:pyrimidine operon attenuation protein/uracil phosphoribosyltransferase
MENDDENGDAVRTSARHLLYQGGQHMRRVMSAEDLGRVVRRVAHEIVERNQGIDRVLILGIPTRGRPFADRLAGALTDIEGETVIAGSLDIGMYRDDLDTRPRTRIGPTDIPKPIDGADVVLVDDVLFTGRTIRAALDALADLGRPASVQLAVVVDRGHRQLPIRADYVGKNIPTSISEHVSVRMRPIDDEDGVWVGEESDA